MTSILKNYFINISLVSEIPAGWGLKSSSAVSNAISLACYKLLDDQSYRQIGTKYRGQFIFMGKGEHDRGI